MDVLVFGYNAVPPMVQVGYPFEGSSLTTPNTMLYMQMDNRKLSFLLYGHLAFLFTVLFLCGTACIRMTERVYGLNECVLSNVCMVCVKVSWVKERQWILGEFTVQMMLNVCLYVWPGSVESCHRQEEQGAIKMLCYVCMNEWMIRVTMSGGVSVLTNSTYCLIEYVSVSWCS